MEERWKINTCANGHKTCDNLQLSADDIFEVITDLEKWFHVRYESPLEMGLDMVSINIQIDGKRIMVGWDNWSGIFIMSDSDQGDALVEQIYRYLESQ